MSVCKTCQRLSRSLGPRYLDSPASARWRYYSTDIEPQRGPTPRTPSTPPASRPSASQETDVVDWKPNEFNPVVDVDELLSYPFLNLKGLSRFREPPTRFRALVRDFVDDSLYNPSYGYFSTQAEILDFGANEDEGFKFCDIKNDIAFDNEVAKRYGSLSNAVAVPGKGEEAARQIWHTPTELFKPWYARAVARYLAAEYKSTLYESGQDLVIYELGAGNGTLMRGILDYLADKEPEAYARTRYEIIEISPRLASLQRLKAEKGRHAHKLRINNMSIFDWKTPVPEACFFLAFEVLDNFAHDVVRYTSDTHTPMQCFVVGDRRGDLADYYEVASDPLIVRFLNLFRHTSLVATRPHVPRWAQRSPFLRHLRATFPFAGNFGPPIFIPTKALLFLDVLRDYFPHHSLLTSDFHYLPEAIKGANAPVVQTRYKGMTIPCTTYLVTPGFFDIFFPTDFELLSELYALVLSPAPYSTTVPTSFSFFDRIDTFRPLQIATHRDFLRTWAEPRCTMLRDGSDPMLEFYSNASFASSCTQDLAVTT